MVDNSSFSKIKESLSSLDISFNSSSNIGNYSGTYIFVSFDLVNSTAFKNKHTKWPPIFFEFYLISRKEMKDNFFYSEFWKMIGDESLFYIPIRDCSELVNIPEKVYEIMHKCTNTLHEKYPETNGILSIKSTIWSAFLIDGNIEDDNKNKNYLIKTQDIDKIVLDFLGPDIDIGFRISKFSLQGKLVIDAKLACLLTKLPNELTKSNISSFLKIVSYESLKGVWDNRRYPIVWYNKNWKSMEELFVYDEEYDSEIVKELKKSKLSSADDVTRLTKIFCDLNKTKEIEVLKNGIEIYKNNNPDGIINYSISRDRLSEIHFVAACANDNKILIAKRTNKKELYPGKWEFGCSQLKLNKKIDECLIEGYKKDFNIDILIDDPPKIVGIYYFSKENENRIIPGIILLAQITDITNLKLSNKHSEYKWVSKSYYKRLIEEECVPDLKSKIKYIFDNFLNKTK